MSDFYEEILVKQGNGVFRLVFKIACLVFSMVSGFSALLMLQFVFAYFDLTSILLFVFSFAACVVLFASRNRYYVEYEYLLTENELDVDKVTSNSRRKHLITVNLSTILDFGPKRSEELNKYSDVKDVKFLNYTLNANSEQYYMYFVQGGKQTLLMIEPTAKLLERMREVNPRVIS